MPTTYTLDLAAPLVTALTERTGATTKQYLYGQGDSPLASYDGAAWTYLSGRDGLNSVRQETDASGNVLTARSFDPYGVPLASHGNGGSPFGYTGEQTDVTGLVFLRARYMQPGLGMFLSKDLWTGYEQTPGTYNGFNYAMGSPVNTSDPSGLQTVRVGGLAYILRCFDIHTASIVLGVQGDRTTAQQAVDICRAAHSASNWSQTYYHFEPGLDLPKTANELLGWFVHDWRGRYNSDRLSFGGNEPLTKELAKTVIVNHIRNEYYASGPIEQTEYRYNMGEFFETTLFDSPTSMFEGSVAISVFMGSFRYQVKTVKTDMTEERVGFRIDNETTLSSGSHIVGRFDPEYYDNVEDLISPTRRPDLANRPVNELIRDTENFKLISILHDRTRKETGGQGGGNMYQTYTWTEKSNCFPPARWLTAVMGDIQVWNNYQSTTLHPPGWPAQ